jgi:hypothetical protein
MVSKGMEGQPSYIEFPKMQLHVFDIKDELIWKYESQGSFTLNIFWHATRTTHVQHGERIDGLSQWPQENYIWNQFW